MSVRYFGVAEIRKAIERGMALARYFEGLVRAQPGLEVMSEARFGVVCFRLHPDGIDDSTELDRINEAALTAIVKEGRYFISSTRLHGSYAMRICVLGFRTGELDMEGLANSLHALIHR
jgi:aromatic-L-amino-acid decarboxylase